MKICAIICEYNPFHNGHLYQLQEAKRLSGADALLCIMSGNFVQRGEAAIMEKRTRAKHAVLAGADVVVELPVHFATSNAELFAKGAIHLLSSIPDVDTLCFGAENTDTETFLKAAKLLNDEPEAVSSTIKELTANGISYAKARAIAYAPYLPDGFLIAPNTILGVEYTRAILSKSAPIRILPIARRGSGYKDAHITAGYASATAIRAAVESGSPYAHALPDFVSKDMPDALSNGLERLEKLALLQRSPAEIATVCDCTEGLENAFKKAAELPASLTETLTSPRYTSARIRRIALQNLLCITEAQTRSYLTSSLYLRVLAVKKARKDVLSALGVANFPALLRGRDGEQLSAEARQCYERDLFAEKIYRLIYPVSEGKDIFW